LFKKFNFPNSKRLSLSKIRPGAEVSCAKFDNGLKKPTDLTVFCNATLEVDFDVKVVTDYVMSKKKEILFSFFKDCQITDNKYICKL
jgi:hypothetical protein